MGSPTLVAASQAPVPTSTTRVSATPTSTSTIRSRRSARRRRTRQGAPGAFRLLHLEALARELQRPAVLRHGPLDRVRHAGRNLGREPPLASGLLHDSCRSFSNNVQHKLGLRQHGDMTAVGFEDRCPHALCDEALQLGLDGLVLGGYDVPAWLGSPGCSFNLLIEEIRCRRSMCCPDEFLLMLRQITGKGRNAVWFQPNTSVCHFNMREYVCGRKLFLQTLCRFISIWRKRSDVNESGDTSVRPGGSDDGSSIGVTD